MPNDVRRRYSIVCGFRWSTVWLPGFSTSVRYTTIPSASALLESIITDFLTRFRSEQERLDRVGGDAFRGSDPRALVRFLLSQGVKGRALSHRGQ